jgi:hypothetical protein
MDMTNQQQPASNLPPSHKKRLPGIIDGTQPHHWYTCANGTLLDAAFYGDGDARVEADRLTDLLGVPCTAYCLWTGPGPAMWTVKRQQEEPSASAMQPQ